MASHVIEETNWWYKFLEARRGIPPQNQGIGMGNKEGSRGKSLPRPLATLALPALVLGPQPPLPSVTSVKQMELTSKRSCVSYSEEN